MDRDNMTTAQLMALQESGVKITAQELMAAARRQITEMLTEDELKEQEYEQQTANEDKYYLVFYGDSGAREDCSVYYSTLILAKSRKEAIAKYVAHHPEENSDRLDAERMELLQ